LFFNLKGSAHFILGNKKIIIRLIKILFNSNVVKVYNRVYCLLKIIIIIKKKINIINNNNNNNNKIKIKNKIVKTSAARGDKIKIININKRNNYY